jgi:Autophagy-related protein 2, middle RBG modules
MNAKPSLQRTLLPSQFSVSLSDCTVGLNPLDLPSRGIILITSTAIRGQWDFQEGGRGKFDLNLNKAHLFCIDDVSHLVPPRQTRFRLSGRKEIVGYFNVCYVLTRPDR